MENINTFTKNDKLVEALKKLFVNKRISVFIKNYKEFRYPNSGLEGFSFEYEIRDKFDEDAVICKSFYNYNFVKISPWEDIFNVILEDLQNNNITWYDTKWKV